MSKTKRFRQPLAFLVVFFCFAASCLAQTRDYWVKTQRKGTDFVSEHNVVRPLENGCFEYRSDVHMKMDLLGVKQDLIQKGIYIVDANLRPVSFDVHTKARATDTRVTGKCADGVMDLTITYEDGDVLKRQVAFENTYFVPVLCDLIVRREKEKSFKIRFFEPQALIVADAQVEVGKCDESGVEATLTHYFTEKLNIDHRGYINEAEFVELGMRSYVADANSAQEIDYLDTADGYILLVKSEKSFPNVYKVSRAQIQVKWKDVAFEKFNFEDNRQKVMKKTSTKEGYEVVLEFVKAPAASKGVKVPIDNEEFAPFLKETDFVKPGDPEIQKQIAQIRGGEEDAFVVTEKILKWISANVKPDLIIEALTGPEVLKKKRGKCGEYAILFASLSRAAGIPTKFALGDICMGPNTWGGHLWNEVWLGQWMAVDASQGSFVTGPSLVKFVESPTVMGTQYVRNGLVDNLSIEILDFVEEQTTSAAEITTGISGNTYSNEQFACRISAPIGWTISETTKAGVPIVTMEPKAEEGITFSLVLVPVPPGTLPKAILDGQASMLAGMVKNFKKLEEGEIEITGRKAPRMVFEHEGKDEAILVNESCVLVDGANGYFLGFHAPKDRFRKIRDSVKEIYESFELVK